MTGSFLHGIWALPKDFLPLGLLWEMESHKCFRTLVKVSHDPESNPFTVQSCDFFAAKDGASTSA